MSATHPPTAVLWQLLQEGGAVVNTADLRRAFVEVMKGGGNDNSEGEEEEDEGREDERERALVALFYRSLAELKFLGWVRRAGGKSGKGDCLVKGGWKGL